MCYNSICDRHLICINTYNLPVKILLYGMQCNIIQCIVGNFGEVLIWQHVEFGKDCQIKKLANIDYCMWAFSAKNSDCQNLSFAITN